MRRPRTALIAAIVAVALSASILQAQVFGRRRPEPPPSPATATAQPADGQAAAPTPGVDYNPMLASRGARQLLRNGLDYLDSYDDPERAYEYLRQADTKRKELTGPEQDWLRSALARCEKRLSARPNEPAAPALADRATASPRRSEPTGQPRSANSYAPEVAVRRAGAVGDPIPLPPAADLLGPAPEVPVALGTPEIAEPLTEPFAAPLDPAMPAQASTPASLDPMPMPISAPDGPIGLTTLDGPTDEPVPAPIQPQDQPAADGPIGLTVLNGPADAYTPAEPAPAPVPAPVAQGGAPRRVVLPVVPVGTIDPDHLPDLPASEAIRAPGIPAPADLMLTPADAPEFESTLAPAAVAAPTPNDLMPLPEDDDPAPPVGVLTPFREVHPDVAGNDLRTPFDADAPAALPAPAPGLGLAIDEPPPPLPADDLPGIDLSRLGQASEPAPADFYPPPAELPPSARPATPPPAPAAATDSAVDGLPTLPIEALPEPIARRAVPSANLLASADAEDTKVFNPDTLREVRELVRRQDDEMRTNPPSYGGLDGVRGIGSADDEMADTRVNLPRAPSPTEVRPIKPIAVPDEFVRLEPRVFTPNRKYWTAPATCHMPLYFQDAVLERYGQSAEQALGPLGRKFSYPLDDPTQSTQRMQLLQPAYSTGLFALQLLAMPYNMLMDPPWEAHYDLGYYRPGDPIPPDTVYWPKTGLGPPLHGKRY